MHGYTFVAFHPKVFRVSLFIFSQGMASLCNVYLLSYITMTHMSKMKTTDYTGVSDKEMIIRGNVIHTEQPTLINKE